MTEATTSTTSTESYDTYLDSIYDYFGVEMTLEDFLDIDDLDAFFAQLVLDAEAAGKDVDFDAFESDFKEEVKDLHYYLYEQASELQAIIDSTDSSVSEVAQAELLLEEIEELDALADDDGENYLLDAWDDGQELSAELSQTITEGESTTISPDDPQNGQNYTVTIEAADDSDSGSSMNDDTNANNADLDGDGYKETNWDTDGDGVLSTEEANVDAEWDIDGDGSTEALAQEVGDRDGDGEVTAADFTYAGDTATTVTIDLEEGDVLEYADWNSDTNTVMYRVTKEDGTIYYITLENVTENTKIICDTVPTNLDSIPDYISSKSWEFSNSQYSYYYFQDGHTGEYDAGTATDTSQAYIYLEDDADHTAVIEPSAEDFAAGKDYTVYFTGSTADNLSIELPEGSTVEYTEDADGNTVMTVTCVNEDGETETITITLVGYEYEDDEDDAATNDIIGVTVGGIAMEDSDDDGIPETYGTGSAPDESGEADDPEDADEGEV